MTAVAGRPSWVRPQQQPALPTALPALSLDTAPHAQLQRGAVNASPWDTATAVALASSPQNAPGRPCVPPGAVAVEQASIVEEEALVISQQARSASRLAEIAAQKLHKPLVFDIEDSFDDEGCAPCEEPPEQPAFSINKDDPPNLPSAQNTHLTCAPPDKAHLPSTSALPTVQLHPGVPGSNQNQPAPTNAAISPPRAAAQVEEGFPLATGTCTMQQVPSQHANRAAGFGSPSLGCLPTNTMTVPDTPPCSHASHASSPTDPAWLSPMLIKHQPGQGRQYSPSMLGRPGMDHTVDLVMQAKAAAQLQHPSRSMDKAAGLHIEGAAQPAGPLHLPERPVLKPVAAPITWHKSPGNIRPESHSQQHRQTGRQAADQLPSSVQASAAAFADHCTRPSTAVVAAATGAFTDRDSQEPDYATKNPSDDAKLPTPQRTNLASDAAAAQFKRPNAAAIANCAMTCSCQSGSPIGKLARSQQGALQLTPERSQPLPGVLNKDRAAAWPAAPQAALADACTDAGTGRAASDQAAADGAAASSSAVPMAATAAAAAGTCTGVTVAGAGMTAIGATAEVATAERGKAACQPNPNSAGLCAMPDADDWNWQQSQANLGFHDAFEPSQGFGVTQALSPASAWAPPAAAAPSVKSVQQSYQGVTPAMVAGLPLRAALQQRLQAGSTSTALRDFSRSDAKHVPFSNRRVALPVSKPQIKQPKVGADQQPDAEVLPVRKPLPKQRAAQDAQGDAPTDSARTCKQPLSDAVSAGKHGDSPMASAAGCFGGKTDHPPATEAQAAAANSSSVPAVPACPVISSRHNTIAAATGVVDHAPIIHEASGDCTAASARNTGVPAEKTAAPSTATFGSSVLATAVASKKAGNSAAAAAIGKTPPAAASRLSNEATAAATATSPAAAIFGPHIACSQLHAKKKLCLRLAPRQPETAPPTSSEAVPGGAPQQPVRLLQAEQLPQAQHAPSGTTAPAHESHTAQRNGRHQHLGGAENIGLIFIENQAVNNGNSRADDGSRAVLSPTDNKLTADSPEAATPAGQPS